ncbi:MAG: SH3 domain-containing protein [Chitinophagales bacterium]|nr:SH3 domain-containing protein [Chitinophagales bacterium]
MRKLSFLLALAFCAWHCGQTPEAPPPPTPATPPPSPEPEVYWYFLNVDKLNLRDQPNKQGAVIAQLAEGDFVSGNGEVSANKEEVTLRNIPFNEPYFKVKTTTNPPQEGWVFSAALVPVYAGAQSTSPDIGKLSAFSRFLSTLDPKKLENGKKAWDDVRQNFSNVQGVNADGVFILLERFLFRMETDGDYYTLTEKVPFSTEEYEAINADKFNMSKYPITQKLAENGFRLATGEGMVFPVVDWVKLSDFFATKVTPAMKNYLEQTTREQLKAMMDDGGILLPLEEVADRAVWWEKFNQTHPYFVRWEETQNHAKGLEFLIVCGADNTPVFNYEDKTVLPEYQKVWAYIKEKYAGTNLEKSVRNMSDLIASEGGKCTKKVEEYREKLVNQ